MCLFVCLFVLHDLQFGSTLIEILVSLSARQGSSRPFPKGTVPFGVSYVPFGLSDVPFGSTLKPTYFNIHLNYLNLKTIWALNIELSEHWTELKCFVDSGTHAASVWYWQSPHPRWGAWSWETTWAFWPVNSGENTAARTLSLLETYSPLPLHSKIALRFWAQTICSSKTVWMVEKL